jgi:hypothetical protein
MESVAYRPMTYAPRRDFMIRAFNGNESSSGKPQFFREVSETTMICSSSGFVEMTFDAYSSTVASGISDQEEEENF